MSPTPLRFRANVAGNQRCYTRLGTFATCLRTVASVESLQNSDVRAPVRCPCRTMPAVSGATAKDRSMPQIHWCCSAVNDIVRVAARGKSHVRIDDALDAAGPGDGVALLCGDSGIPVAPPTVQQLATANSKRLRLYWELPEGPKPPTDHPVLHRAVVPQGSPVHTLPALSLLGLPTRKVVPVPTGRVWLVTARVAGYDKADFGLPSDAKPLLVETEISGVPTLVASTSLSDVIRARFGPTEAWQSVWTSIVSWLAGEPVSPLHWIPNAHPTFRPAVRLPKGADRSALVRGIAWIRNSGMLLGPDHETIYDGPAVQWPDRVGPRPAESLRPGDGSRGILEGLSSRIDSDGSQPVRWWRRADCIGEMSGATALASIPLASADTRSVATNLGDYLLEKSILTSGKRSSPSNPAYGLIGWNDVTRYYGDMDGYGVYYPDDMCRCLIGLLAARTVLGRDRWDNRLAKGLLANLRLCSTRGFVPDRVDEAPFEAGGGWEPHFRGTGTSVTAHYQGWVWASFLRANALSGESVFLERARAGLKRLVETHPNGWNCANGSLSLEESRILLPLAWLVRADDRPEHRAWLRTFIDHFRRRQDASGLPAEALARPTAGVPQSNAEYGVAETSLLQRNGDPVADLLYTANFAAVGLHEATALEIPGARDAADQLMDGLVRIQVESGSRQLDGAWFRAFDFRRWEYWASNADVGWGAWAVETGWTQSWICAVLAMRLTKTNLWDQTSAPGLGQVLRRWRPVFIPDSLLKEARVS